VLPVAPFVALPRGRQVNLPSVGGWRLSGVLPEFLSLSAQLIAKANYFWYFSECSLGVIAAGQASSGRAGSKAR